MELSMRLAAWRAWRRRAACGLVGDVGNAWWSKCLIVSARKCHKGASLQACCSDEMGNSALKIFATCGFAVAVSDCSLWGA